MIRRLKIALVFPRSGEKNPHPPLGLASLAAVLLDAGHEVKVIDAAAPNVSLTDQGIKDIVESFSPDIVGVSINIYLALFAYDLAKVLSSKDYLLVAGGPHPTVKPEEALQNSFDLAIRGEGENTFLALANKLSRGESYHDLAGITYFNNGNVVNKSQAPLIEDLDALPFPALELFPKEDYEGILSCEYGGFVVTSRGCPYTCTFCFKTFDEKSIRFRSTDNIIEEMNRANERYGTTEFYIADETFTMYHKRLKEFCLKMQENPKKYRWMANSTINSVTPKLLGHMKKAGCFALAYGFETGDQMTMNRLNKAVSMERSEKVMEWTKSAGISVRGYIMMGFPWETTDNARNTYEFLRRNDNKIDSFLQMGFFIPFPGTALFEEYKSQFKIDNWWMDRNIINNYAQGEWLPIHHKIYFNDMRLLRRDCFFPHSRAIKKVYRKIAKHMGDKNFDLCFPLGHYGLIRYYLLYFIVKSSQYLYQQSLFLWKLYMKLLLRLTKPCTDRLYKLLK
jgi:magnesium-protoporphyrin IX monomethyl ester (oxidative) cyclase